MIPAVLKLLNGTSYINTCWLSAIISVMSSASNAPMYENKLAALTPQQQQFLREIKNRLDIAWRAVDGADYRRCLHFIARNFYEPIVDAPNNQDDANLCFNRIAEKYPYLFIPYRTVIKLYKKDGSLLKDNYILYTVHIASKNELLSLNIAQTCCMNTDNYGIIVEYPDILYIDITLCQQDNTIPPQYITTGGRQYQWSASVCYYGNSASGHYISYIRDGSKIYRINYDERVEILARNSILYAGSTALIYHRII